MHWLALGTGLLFTQPAAPDPRDPAAPIELTPPEPDPPPPAAPTPDLPPRTDPQPPVRSHRIGRLPGYIGLGAGVGLTGRTIGGADRSAATTAYGAVHGRIAGYSQRKAGHGRRLEVILLPEVQLDLELGGTAAPAPAAHGVMVGTSGVLDIGVGFASPGRVGAYLYFHAGQRFQARLHTDLEGAHWLGTPGATAGLRVHHGHALTLLVGGGVDGTIGAQRLLARSTLVAQLAPVAALALYSEPTDDLYIGVLGRFDATVLGQDHGGARLHGRSTFEVMWRVRRAAKIRLATLLLTYEGTRITAAAGHPQFDPLGERRTSHQLLLALGATF